MLRFGALSLLLLATDTWTSYGLRVQDEGTLVGSAKTVNFTGAGVTCAVSSSVATCDVPGGGGPGGGAPTTAQYWTGAADGTLSAEKNLGALSTGLVVNTAGTPSAYAGTSCTNQFPRSLSASGAATCASVSLSADITGTLSQANGGTGSGAVTCTAGQTLTSNGTTYSCTQPVRSGTLVVDFGSGAQSEYDTPAVTVAATWVSASSSIVLTPKCIATVGSNTIDNCRVLDMQCTVVNIIASTSFDVACHAPYTASGQYTVSYFGG